MKQQPTKPVPTTAQLAVLHGLQSAGLAGVISILMGIIQYLTTGNIDLKSLLSVLGASFMGALAMIYKSVSSNPQLAQAALDTANEAIARIEQIAPWIGQNVAQKTAISKQPTSIVPAVPAPQPITFPQPVRTSTPPAQYPQQGATQQSFNPNQSMLGTLNLNNPANQPPAMSFLQERPQGG